MSSFAIICFPSLQFDIGISFFQFLGSNTTLLYQFQLTSYVTYNKLPDKSQSKTYDLAINQEIHH